VEADEIYFRRKIFAPNIFDRTPIEGKARHLLDQQNMRRYSGVQFVSSEEITQVADEDVQVFLTIPVRDDDPQAGIHLRQPRIPKPAE
jgi:hypothetical protein